MQKKKFKVTFRRTIVVTAVIDDATTAKELRDRIHAYGVPEFAIDAARQDESDDTRIVSIKEVK